MSCPPVPPPPPPLPYPNKEKISRIELQPADEESVRQEVERQWMLFYCSKTEVGDDSCKPLWLAYKHITPVAQIGPTCGLAALAAALGGGQDMMMNSLKIAQSLGLTIQGEMFSAKDLSIVTAKMSGCAVESPINELLLVHHLIAGGLVLVPYDAGPDHAPANCGGSKAHWALLCGVLRCPRTERIFVIAVQGKSRRHAVWPLDKLIESNIQLSEAAPDKQGNDFVVHDLSYSLASHCLLLPPTQNV